MSPGKTLLSIAGAAVVAIFALGIAPSSAAEDGPSYTLRQSIPAAEKLRLVLDMSRSEISLRLGEVELRGHAFTVTSDSEAAAEFLREWPQDHSDEQIVESVHLLSAAMTISESELNVIGEETALDADDIQRFLPGRMVLITDKGSRIYIDTDCPGAEAITLERMKELFRRIWYGLTAGEPLHISMAADDAMSLYGAARTRPTVTIRL